jgi:hypothetical protein
MISSLCHPAKILFLLPALLCCAPTALLANLVKNGDFEAPPVGETSYSFGQTPHWFNWVAGPDAQNTVARSDSLQLDDSMYSAMISNQEPEGRVFLQKTEHLTGEGDTFSLTFHWLEAYRWTPGDTLRMVIFVTHNDTLGGNVVWEDAVDFRKSSDGLWVQESHTFAPVGREGAGRVLFFKFVGLPVQAPQAGFARVDNIVLTKAE